MKEDIYTKNSQGTENLCPMALRTDGGRHKRSEWSGSATNLWKTAASKDEDTAALTHQGKPYCTVTAKASAQATANEKISPNLKISTGKLPRHRICRRNLNEVPIVTTTAKCGTTCTVWTKIWIALRLQASVACWPKPHFRTEVPKFTEI